MKLDLKSEEILDLVIKASKEFRIDPLASLEAEEYFSNLLQRYEGENTPAKISDWLRKEISARFLSIAPNDQRPNWIQAANWPFHEGLPMAFMGQINLSTLENEKLQAYFHDDVSIYVFITKAGETKTIIQVY